MATKHDQGHHDETTDQVAEIDYSPIFQHLAPGYAVRRTSYQSQCGGGEQLTAQNYAEDQAQGEADTTSEFATTGRQDGDVENKRNGDEGSGCNGQHEGFGGRLGRFAISNVFGNGRNGFWLQTVKRRFCFHVMLHLRLKFLLS